STGTDNKNLGTIRPEVPCATATDCNSLGTGYSCTAGVCIKPTQCIDNTGCSSRGPEYRCVASTCVRDPLSLAAATTQNSEMKRRAECLADDTTVPLVTAGKRSLCVWRDANDANRVCQVPAGASTPTCPKLTKVDSLTIGAACPASYFPTPSTGSYTRELVTT